MPAPDGHALLWQLRGLALACADAARPDHELLARYVGCRDEAAFAALVHRHGPVVWGVCHRLLGDDQEAEDAFQATFLILARKAASVRRKARVGCWLHGVASRVARKLRADLARRRRVPDEARPPESGPEVEVSWREVRAVLDEELARLPETYRAPLLLCYLEGLTQDEAARRLGWPPGVLRGRLDRGRQRLKARLARRGLALSAALLGAVLGSPSPAPALAACAAVKAAAGRAPASPHVVALVEGVLSAMLLNKLKTLTALTLALALGGLLLALLAAPLGAQDGGNPFGKPPPPAQGPAPRPGPADLEKRVAELEKKVERLTRELADLRGGKGAAVPPGDGEAKVIRLRNAAAADLALVLDDAFNKGAAAKRVRVIAEPVSNSLLVQAAPADLKAVEDLVARLDAEGKAAPPSEPVFKVFGVKAVGAAAAVKVLEKIFDGPKVRITAVGEGSVAFYGTEEEVLRAARIIAELEEASR